MPDRKSLGRILSDKSDSLVFYRYVEGSELLTCGNFLYNQYHDCKDTNNFLSADKIADIVCLPMNRVPEITPVLACQDRVLRVLQVCICADLIV